VIKKKEISQDDKQTWENYIKNPSDIYDKDKKANQLSRKYRFRYDLHGLSLNDANNKVTELIFHCSENRFKELLLITGKGIHSTNDQDIYTSKELGKLKFSVPEFIKTNSELSKLVLSVNQAEKIDGGEGAIIIKLRTL
tara:strand:+ start:121 stop:537 length:417 start_codon:yes stop_codon:yes gene_type:complete